MPVFQGGQKQVMTLAGPATIPVDTGGAPNCEIPVNGGTFTMNGATPVTVANTNVTDGSIIIFTLKTVGGTVGAYPAIQTITPGTGFTVAGTALDTSIYNYTILA